MSILNALRNALTGLDAQSDKLSTISNNIANSATVGFKSTDTEFESMVIEGGNASTTQVAGVQSVDRTTISQAGQVTTTGVNTDIAVNGEGMLVVNTAADPTTGKYLVTRAGSFRPDSNGNLVNSGGYYLQGVPLDASGNPVSSLGDNNVDSLSTVNVSNVSVASSPTTTMTFNANLPSDNTAYASPAPDANTTSVDYYDPLGKTQTMTMKFTPTVAASATAADTNTWTMDIYDSASVSATNTTGLVGEAKLVFNATGSSAGTLASVTATSSSPTGTGLGYSSTLGTFTVPTGNGANLPITIGTLNSTGGMTQLSGTYVATKIQKDGSTFGLLENVSIGTDGKITGNFSNGATRPLYQLDLAVFPNENGLTAVNGDAYEMSAAAGVPRLLKPGQGSAGTTSGGSLEGSNVDIGNELTNLIETQRAYQSNATVVTTSDQMLQILNQMKG